MVFKKLLTIGFLGLILIQAPSSFAEELTITVEDKQMPFPLPYGTVKITNGYSGGATHSNKSRYALDMQVPHPNATNGCDHYGVPILAARDGIVEKIKNAEEDGAFGTHVIIKSDKNIHIWYAHMIRNSLQVEHGEEVYEGQLLGLMGDTGNTISKLNCGVRELVDGDEKKYQKKLVGVHLHTEMRQGMYEDWAIPLKFSAIIGEEIYTDIKVGDYESISSMLIDKANYWNRMKHYFSYVLPPEALEGSHIKPPQLIGIHPLIFNQGKEVTFTITGALLPQNNIEVDIPGCGEKTWIINENGRRGLEKQQFTCAINQTPGIYSGHLTIPNKDKEKAVKLNLEMLILNPGEKIPGTRAEILNANDLKKLKPGDFITIQIKGQNLPGSLNLEMPACEEVKYIFKSPTSQTIECTVANHSYDEGGKRQSGNVDHYATLKDGQGRVLTHERFNVNQSLVIKNITPKTAHFGTRTSFTITGKNAHTLQGAYIEQCGELVTDTSMKDMLIITCTPLMPPEFFDPLMPESQKRKNLDIYLKVKAGGETILAGKILAIGNTQAWVYHFDPINPILGEKVTFTAKGNHLPDKLVAWMPDCENVNLENIYKTVARFNCEINMIHPEENKIKIDRAAKAFKQQNEILTETVDSTRRERKEAKEKITQLATNLVEAIETQRRQVLLKYPGEYSTLLDSSKKITFYSTSIVPVSKNYSSLYDDALKIVEGRKAKAAWNVDGENGQEVIDYLVEHQDDYQKKDKFLEELGWRNVGTSDDPIYELMECSQALKDLGQGQYFRNKLNVTGPCAQGLNDLLIEDELDRFYR